MYEFQFFYERRWWLRLFYPNDSAWRIGKPNKNKSIILTLLNKSNLHTLEWYFKVPYFTLFRKVEINLYFLLLIILLILNIKKFKIKYLNYFIILEMLLLSI